MSYLTGKEDCADAVKGMDPEMGEVILDYLGPDLITGVLESTESFSAGSETLDGRSRDSQLERESTSFDI